MLKASFVFVERHGIDLILSFAIEDEKYVAGIRNLILLRTPKFEPILDESERGVRVTLEGEDKIPGVPILDEFDFSSDTQTVSIRTHFRTYKIDLRAVDAKEIQDMRKIIQKMNFDNSFELSMGPAHQ